MSIEKPGLSPKNKESEESSKKEQMNKFTEKLKEIERQVALINAVGDKLDKESKLRALEIIRELKTTTDLDKRKELVFELERKAALINVSHGDELDKEAKQKVLELIPGLK